MTASPRTDIRLAELLAGLSLVVDLGIGQPVEHVLRQTLIAKRLGESLDLSEQDRAALYYISLLAWVGCGSDSHELATWFGDDLAWRAASYEIDPVGRATLGFLSAKAAAVNPPLATTGTADAATLSASTMEHCVVTREFAERVGLGRDVAEPLVQLFARWDGRGRRFHTTTPSKQQRTESRQLGRCRPRTSLQVKVTSLGSARSRRGRIEPVRPCQGASRWRAEGRLRYQISTEGEPVFGYIPVTCVFTCGQVSRQVNGLCGSSSQTVWLPSVSTVSPNRPRRCRLPRRRPRPAQPIVEFAAGTLSLDRITALVENAGAKVLLQSWTRAVPSACSSTITPMLLSSPMSTGS